MTDSTVTKIFVFPDAANAEIANQCVYDLEAEFAMCGDHKSSVVLLDYTKVKGLALSDIINDLRGHISGTKDTNVIFIGMGYGFIVADYINSKVASIDVDRFVAVNPWTSLPEGIRGFSLFRKKLHIKSCDADALFSNKSRKELLEYGTPAEVLEEDGIILYGAYAKNSPYADRAEQYELFIQIEWVNILN